MGYDEEAKQMMVRLQPRLDGKLVDDIGREVVRLGPEALELILSFPDITSLYAGVRSWIAKRALEMELDGVLPILIKALSHPNWSINQIARDTLAQMGTDVKDALVENLASCKEPWGRHQTLLCLHRLSDPFGPMQIGDKSLIPYIENVARSDESEVVRGTAVEVLSRSEAFEAEKTIVKALGDSDEPVRRQAVKACLRLRLKKSVKPLIEMLGDAAPELRAEIIYTLDKIGDLGTAEAVRKHLTDKDWYVRWAAAKALENLWEEGNIEPLKHAAEDENQNVAVAAIETLAAKAPEGSSDILEKIAASGSGSVSSTAKFYIEKMRKVVK